MYTISSQDYFFYFCDFDRKNMGSVFHAICYTFPGPNCFVTVLKYIAQ